MPGQFGYSGGTNTTKLRPWWKDPKNDKHDMLFKECSYLLEQQRKRKEANIHFLRLYTNRATASFSPHALADGVDVTGERIRLNIVKSAIDAAVAQIGTNRPRPLYQTEGGDYSVVKRAERRGKFVTGIFHVIKQYMLGLEVFRDACCFGTGLEYVYGDPISKSICAERVLPDELLVDTQDGRDGNPRIMRRVKTVSRQWLLDKYGDTPTKKAKIGEATCLEVDNTTVQTIADPVTMCEAWMVPSYPGADDGAHVLCLSNITLVDEEWCRGFPIAGFTWGTMPMGFWGMGAAEEISPIQVEVNYIAQKIQKLMTLATTLVWKEKGSFVGDIDNRDFAQREYTGKPPVFQTTAAISAEYFHHLDRLYTRAYELVGISQLSATSKKPSGLDSGEALRTYNDIGTRRFQHIGQRWEQFYLDISELVCEAAKDLEAAGVPVKVLAAGDRDAEEVTFKDVDMAKERYILRPHPVSIMPDTPAGKLETATRLAQMAPDLGPYLMRMIAGIPDLERAVKMANAPLDYAEECIADILEHGEYTQPDGFMNLPLTRDVAQRALLRARIDNIEAKKLDMLQRFIADIDELQMRAEQSVQQAAMGPPMGGGPAPTPGAVLGAPRPPLPPGSPSPLPPASPGI